MLIKHLSLFVIALSLVGCAAGVKHSNQENKQYLTTTPAARVSISFTDEAKTKISDNLKFNQNTLLDHVKRAMVAKNLLNEARPDGHVVEVVVKDFRVRSNFSAVMFGFMAGDDNIKGDVVLRDLSGKELNRFEVTASYALGGFGGGQDDARMGWLYEKFAELTVANLAGQPK